MAEKSAVEEGFLVRKLKRKEKKWIVRMSLVLLCVLVVSLYVILCNQTTIMNQESYGVVMQQDAYVFKRQAVSMVQTEGKIDFAVESGSKVSAATVLSEECTISASAYAQQMVDAIDLILQSDGFSSVEEFLTLMQQKQSQIEEIQAALDTEEDPERKATLQESLEILQDDYFVMQIAVRFVFSERSYLEDLRETYTQRLSSKDTLSLTLGNLNFPFTGYVYYTLDGYESALSSSMIASMDFAYWDYLSSLRPNTFTLSGDTPIKVVNGSYVYLVFKTNADTYLKAQNDMHNKKAEVYQDNDFSSVSQYYEFLQRRMDVLFSYPQVTVYDEDDMSHTAYFVNVLQNEENTEKICIFMVKSDVDSFIDQNIVELSIVAEDYDAYVIDKSSVVYRGEGQLKKAYVLSREKEGLYRYVSVNVFKTVGSKAILRVEDNMENDLENLEIVRHPALRFWQKVEVEE